VDFIFYRDVFGGWRWESHTADGHTQDSQHSYDTRDECVEAAERAVLSASVSVEAKAPAAQPVVLCVQPDENLRQSLPLALGGIQAILASTSLEAIRLMNATVIDAFVIDYHLPGSSGIHLCRHIRRSDLHTPVCFYAATGTEEQRRRAFNAGAGGYVCASAGPDALGDEVERLLQFAELQGARAKVEEERAIQEELERRVVVAIDRTARARALAADAVELAAKAKAYERFTAAGGTPAIFRRWWPETFRTVSTTLANASPKIEGQGTV
jgi:DNA-binding response OmpR family regulator